jgi:hypothetical protein
MPGHLRNVRSVITAETTRSGLCTSPISHFTEAREGLDPDHPASTCLCRWREQANR